MNFDVSGVISASFWKVFWEGPKVIFFRLSSNFFHNQQAMFLKHEHWFRISFLSSFDAWRQNGACCSMNLRWSLNFLPSVSQGVRGGRRVLRTMKGNYLTAKYNQKSKVHCFLRSWLVPASVSMLILMFSSFCHFYKLELSQNHCFWW